MEKILRCTQIEECTHLPRQDLALIIGNSASPLPDGFGCYITCDSSLPPDLQEHVLCLQNAEPGSFIMLREIDGQITGTILPSSNIPERTIFTTGMCNSNCIMCPYTEYYRTHSTAVHVDTLKRYVYLMDPDSDYLCITGGEPTLLKEVFFDLLKTVKEHFDRAIIHILTNGRTFSYESFYYDFIRVRPYKTLLGIPLHGSNPDLHDYISNSSGSFLQTTKGLDLLHRYGEHIEIRIVTSNLNKEDLPQLAVFIAGRYPNVRHVCLMGLEMLGSSMLNRKQVWCSFSELMPYVNQAAEILLTHGIPVQLYNYPLCYIDKKYYSIYRKSITPYKIVYLPECESCKKVNECGGFFRSSSIMPGINVYPF